MDNIGTARSVVIALLGLDCHQHALECLYTVEVLELFPHTFVFGLANEHFCTPTTPDARFFNKKEPKNRKKV